jgi:two-component system cell cycle sensor histidine kinase PleC
VRINGNQELYAFHFDWLTAPDQKKYLVGSQAAQSPNAISAEMSAQDLENFLSLTRDIMAVTNSAGNILRANEAFHTMAGTSGQDENPSDFIDLFIEDDRPFVRVALQSVHFEDSEISETDFDARIKDAEGTIRWIHWRQRQSGNLVYCIGQDVTDAKTHREALKRREKQLGRAESLGRMGHWHWTVGAEDFEWSAELFRIFGVTGGDFKPTMDSMNALIHRRDIDRVNHAFQRSIIQQSNFDVEFRILRPDGEIRYIKCEGRCAYDDEDDVIAVYGIMQDNTERMAYEQELREAKEAAERAYATKSQFLANMSHELRTPLNAIIGFSEMIQRQLLGPVGTEKYLDYIDGIRQSGEHLLDLITDILDMSKIEAGKYELDLIELKVAKAISMATHMMEGRAQEAKIKITTVPVAEDLQIIADRRAFMQIILNLLSNAVKFSEAGDTVRVECHARENYVALKVFDEGIGIAANKLAQITKPFEQVSTSFSRNHQGSGLGLSITKELVEMHGGTLFIESTLGEGTTVTARLPYDASKATKK